MRVSREQQIGVGIIRTAAASLALSGALPASAGGGGGGPQSRYFVASGQDQKVVRLQGRDYIEEVNAAGLDEYALYALGRINTAGHVMGSGGARYKQGLQHDGTNYTNEVSPAIYDATTDGCYLYTVRFGTGEVVRANLDWTNPETLFSLDPAQDYIGITYDPSNHSLWVSMWDEQFIGNYDMQGNEIDSFTPGDAAITCLALDHATGLLWMGSQHDKGVFKGYTKVGGLAGSYDYGFNYNTLGGEFDLGAPAKVKNLIIRKGEHLAGELSDLGDADSNRYRIRSEERNDGSETIICDVKFKSNVKNPGALDVVVLGRVNADDGMCEALIKNRSTGEWDAVDAFTIGYTEDMDTVYNVPAADYINDEGRATVRLRITADESDSDWKAYLNVVQLRVRK